MAEDTNTTTPPGAVPYARRKLKQQFYTGGDVFLNTAINRVADALVAIVTAEGPISIDVAKQRVVEAWSTRRGRKINEYLDEVIAYARRNKQLNVKGDFLWPLGMVVPPLRIHTNGNDIRTILEIPPEEIELAVRECIKSAVGISQDDLIREICRLFGLKAIAETATHIEQTINQLVANNTLIMNSEKITKGSNF